MPIKRHTCLHGSTGKLSCVGDNFGEKNNISDVLFKDFSYLSLLSDVRGLRFCLFFFCIPSLGRCGVSPLKGVRIKLTCKVYARGKAFPPIKLFGFLPACR